MAWNVLQIAAHAVEGSDSSDGGPRDIGIADRRLRYRIRSLLSDAPPPDQWGLWLRNRADERRMWIHPGVLERFAQDERVRPGGNAAVVAAGLGLPAGGQARFYVDEHDVEPVLDAYGARVVDDGQTILMVVPSEVPDDVVGTPGLPVAVAVGLVDLLSSDDARERHAASSLLGDAARELSASAQNNGADDP